MNAAGVTAFAARLQAKMEEIFPCILKVDGDNYDATRGAWRDSTHFDEQSQTLVRTRTVAVRFRTGLLPDGTTIAANVTTVQVDGASALVMDVRRGAAENAWHLTCEAIS